MNAPPRPAPHGPWPRRLALATLLAALPLVLFGGTVTTLRAGMAIDGWWVLEPGRGDHFLLFYPVEKWFRDVGTFVEHTHRLFGTLVGLLSIAYLAASLRWDRRAGARWMALAGLLAVCAQGALGGFRVLESSQDLAFLHGVFAQATLAVLGVNVVLTSRAWVARTRSACERARGLRRAALASVVAVFGQIVLGAWLRHSGSALALLLHVAFVVAVVVALLLAARWLRLSAELGERQGLERAPLRRVRRHLLALLGSQLVLGVAATVAVLVFSGGFEGRVSTGEMVFATAHVLFGTLLLLTSVTALLWSYGLVAPAAEALPARSPEPAAGVAPLPRVPRMEGAR